MLLSHSAVRILEAEQMLGGEGNICHVLDMLPPLALEKRRRIPPLPASPPPWGAADGAAEGNYPGAT